MTAMLKLTREQRSRVLLVAAGGRVSWPEVLRVLPEGETRSYALNRYKQGGFLASSWGTRSSRAAMADALTRTEDWLELKVRSKNRDAQRTRIRGVRRRLEWELWP